MKNYMRQVLIASGVFFILIALSPQEVSARRVIEPEVTALTTIQVNAEKLSEVDERAEEARQKLEEAQVLVQQTLEELEDLQDKKLTLEQEIEKTKAEIAELRARQEAQKRQRELEREERRLERERRERKAEASRTSQAVNYNTSGNGYVWGYCTWYVKNMRPDLPNSLGNANMWYANAQALGLPTGTLPRAGAVGATSAGWLGHVVYVHSVNSNGTINISDMNYSGFGVVTYRTVPASSFVYIY